MPEDRNLNPGTHTAEEENQTNPAGCPVPSTHMCVYTWCTHTCIYTRMVNGCNDKQMRVEYTSLVTGVKISRLPVAVAHSVIAVFSWGR